MRVLLIDPPQHIFTGIAPRFFSPGLASVGAALRAAGHEVAILEVDRLSHSQSVDFANEYEMLQTSLGALNDPSHWIWDAIARLIQHYRPTLVGIMAVTMRFGSVVRVAELSKRLLPDVPVVVGGPHVSDWPEMTMACAAIDYALAGEADETVVDLVAAIEAGETDVSKVPGASFRRNGTAAISHVRPLVASLEHLPMPARDCLLLSEAYNAEDMGVILTSRGCPYKCGFCSHERKVRYRPIEQVLAEVEQCIERYETTQFDLKDDTFGVHRRRTRALCDALIERGYNINWSCSTRVGVVTEELLEQMMRAGLTTAKVGVESGSERILREMLKGITKDEVRDAARMFARAGLFWSGYFMYGLPTESAREMLDTCEFLQQLSPPYAGLGLYAPYPSTRLWDQGVELGLIDPNVPLQHFFETNPKDYFFKDPSRRVATMEPAEFDQLGHYMRDVFRRHNGSPRRLLARARSRRLTYWRHPGLILSDARKAWTLLGGGLRARKPGTVTGFLGPAGTGAQQESVSPRQSRSQEMLPTEKSVTVASLRGR